MIDLSVLLPILTRGAGGLPTRTPDFVSQMPDPKQILGGMPVAKGPAAKLSWWDKLQNDVVPVPEGMKGLLSEDDVKHARMQGLFAAGASLLDSAGPSPVKTSLGQALGRGLQAGLRGYQGAIQNQAQSLAQRQALDLNKLKIGEAQRGIAQADAIKKSRADIIAKHGAPDTGDPHSTAKWIDAVLPEFIAAGDEEMVARLSEIRKSLGGRDQQPRALQWHDVGNFVVGTDPATGQEVARLPKDRPPVDPAIAANRAELNTNRRLQREQSIYNDFQQDTKPAVTATNILNDSLREKDRALAGDVGAQTRILYGFINSMDNTAVREGEQRLVQNAAPLLAQAQAALSKLNTDHAYSVPKPMLEQMIGIMSRRYEGNKTYLKEQERYYRGVAETWDVNPDRFRVRIQTDAEGGATLPPLNAQADFGGGN